MLGVSLHHLEDLIDFAFFFVGQGFYIMKRAGFSMRAGRSKTRRQYVYQNWDILVFRLALQFLFPFMVITHFSVNQLVGIFHIDLSGIEALSMLQTPISNPAALFGFGMGSDGFFDWMVDWASRSGKVPAPIKAWLSENVPPMPMAK